MDCLITCQQDNNPPNNYALATCVYVSHTKCQPQMAKSTYFFHFMFSYLEEWC